MKKKQEYLFSAIALAFVTYSAYKHITSQSAEKYHIESWKKEKENNVQTRV